MVNSESNACTYDLGLLEKSRAKWLRSAALRSVYGDLFDDAIRKMIAGRTLEVGSGIGIAKEFIPGVVTSDCVKTSFVDLECSAYDIPSTDGGSEGWANILAFDVLHHLCCPLDFFQSALSALQPGGRILLLEPAATALGRLLYGICHHEPTDPSRLNPPFAFEPDNQTGEFANMGMGISLFDIHRTYTEDRLARFGGCLQEVSFRDLLAYPLTGGYGNRQFMPAACIRFLLKIERRLPRSIYRTCGLRMVIVIEKTAN